MQHKIKIKMNAAGMGTVELDGLPISTVSVGFNASVDELTEVTLVLPAEVELEADTETHGLTIVTAKKVVE